MLFVVNLRQASNRSISTAFISTSIVICRIWCDASNSNADTLLLTDTSMKQWWQEAVQLLSILMVVSSVTACNRFYSTTLCLPFILGSSNVIIGIGT